MTDSDARPETGIERAEDECPRCGAQGAQNPVLNDWYECSTCVIAFSADGEVETGENRTPALDGCRRTVSLAVTVLGVGLFLCYGALVGTPDTWSEAALVLTVAAVIFLPFGLSIGWVLHKLLIKQ